MIAENQIYKCNLCGNIVELVHAGSGELVCCNQAMELKEANVQEASLEKHVPVVEITANGIKVSVGSVLHPMEDKHYIEWIEVISEGSASRRYLKPGAEPVAEFCLTGKILEVKAYCNLHGLWKNA